MTHVHSHSHGEPSDNDRLDQLFTVLVCLGLAVVAILLYRSEMLNRLVKKAFFIPVLLGGITLLVLVVIRLLAARKHLCQLSIHDNPNQPFSDCEEEPWTPLRYLVLAIPILLFTLGLPRMGFVSERHFGTAYETETVTPKRVALASLAGSPALAPVMRKLHPQTRHLTFTELMKVVGSPRLQEQYQGDIGIVRGQYMPLKVGGGNYFTLFRMNMTCCAADAVPMEVRIVCPDGEQLQRKVRQGDWIWVKGIISFKVLWQQKKLIPLIAVLDNADITLADATNEIDTH